MIPSVRKLKTKMKILKLSSSNVLRLNAVEITPKGDLVIIGGRNGQGKTSVLNSIAMALGGAELIAEEPLKEGEQAGETRIEFDGDLVVTRRYTKSGTTSLTVQTKAGAKMQSPQTVLDRLVGKLTFDPLAFQRLKPEEQKRLLFTLANLDFTKLDESCRQIYEERTARGRDVKRLEAELGALTYSPGLPEAEQSVSELNGRLEKANAKNAENGKARLDVQQLNTSFRNASQKFTEQQNKIARLREELAAEEKELAALETARDKAQGAWKKRSDAVRDLADEDTAGIVAQIGSIEETNRAIRTNADYLKTKNDLKKAQGDVEQFTAQLESAAADKAKQLREAKFPITGLGFTDAGVTFNGKPLAQSSGAEQLRVSVAIGMASNPELKILLCRDGALLDSDSLAILSEIVTANGFQCWLERVGEGDPSAVIIEDGYVKK
jgi:DNA repair exonuclease SbcCD ATPase subunit